MKLYSWVNAKRARVRIKSFRKCSRFNFADVTQQNSQDYEIYLSEKFIIIYLRIYLRNICKRDSSNENKDPLIRVTKYSVPNFDYHFDATI